MRRKTLVFAVLVTSVLFMKEAPVIAGDSPDQREQFVLSEVNRIRAQQGLCQLRLSSKLRAIARRHSSNMAEGGYLSHTDSLGRDFKERLGNKIVERRYAGENVARNNYPDAARVAVEGWCQSPKHLQNILNEKFTETGIGVAVDSEGLVFFTQIFMGK